MPLVLSYFFHFAFFCSWKGCITPYLSPKFVYWSDPKYIFGITFEVLSLYSKAGPSETDDVDDKLPLSKSLQVMNLEMGTWHTFIFKFLEAGRLYYLN